MDQPALHHEHYGWDRARYLRRRVGTSISSRYSKLALINTQTMMYGIQSGMMSGTLHFLEGNVEMFEWVIAHGTCEQDMRTFLQYDYNQGIKLVVRGRLEMLQWYMARLEVENFPDIINHNKNFCLNTKRAAEYGHLEMLKWMVENGLSLPQMRSPQLQKGTSGMRRVLARARVQDDSYGLKSGVRSRPYPRAAMGHRKRLASGSRSGPWISLSKSTTHTQLQLEDFTPTT